jgi:hypothetical protein
MPADTSLAGISVEAKKQNASLMDQKAGSPKGSSNTYDDRPNAASPDLGTIARNQFNSHPAMPMPAGSTSDTGREKP